MKPRLVHAPIPPRQRTPPCFSGRFLARLRLFPHPKPPPGADFSPFVDRAPAYPSRIERPERPRRPHPSALIPRPNTIESPARTRSAKRVPRGSDVRNTLAVNAGLRFPPNTTVSQHGHDLQRGTVPDRTSETPSRSAPASGSRPNRRDFPPGHDLRTGMATCLGERRSRRRGHLHRRKMLGSRGRRCSAAGEEAARQPRNQQPRTMLPGPTSTSLSERRSVPSNPAIYPLEPDPASVYGPRRFPPGPQGFGCRGEVAEWLKAPHSKCGILARVSGVRIPPSPPSAS